MINQEPTYELKGDADVSKFNLGLIRDLRLAKIDLEQADRINKAVENYTKHQLMMCVKKKLKMEEQRFDIVREKKKQLPNKNIDIIG